MRHKYLIAACIVSFATWVCACTTFLISDNDVRVFGRNYDWDIGEGVVIANPRGLAKTAFGQDDPARWTAKYGSITFNQYGREFPCGGMNESGLVVEVMWLPGSAYPAPDRRPAVDNMQWVQYLLDNCSTVAEALATDTAVRVAPLSPAVVHYLISDAGGDCAAIDFLGGHRIVHTGGDLPVRTLTNGPYAEAAGKLPYFRGFGGTDEIPGGKGSTDRFVRAAHLVKRYGTAPTVEPVGYAFGILESVALGSYTKWSVVYDSRARSVSLRTRANRRIRSIDLKRVDFSCDKPALVTDIDGGARGDLTGAFRPYSEADNFALVNRTFAASGFLTGMPEGFVSGVAEYPGSLACGAEPEER